MQGRFVSVSIVRDDGSLSSYRVEHEEYLTVARILNKIYVDQDRTVAYRHFCCNIARCMACLVKVNGKNVQGCKHVVEPGAELRLEAADGGRAISDLVMDFGSKAPKPDPLRTIEV